MSFWMTALVAVSGLVLWELDWELGLKAWWLVNGILALSYVAAMIVERDEVTE